MEQLQNTWNIMHEHFMVLYDVYVGLNNNTEQYTHNIRFGSVSSDQYRSTENDRIGADTDPEYRIDASLVTIHQWNENTCNVSPDLKILFRSVYLVYSHIHTLMQKILKCTLILHDHTNIYY